MPISHQSLFGFWRARRARRRARYEIYATLFELNDHLLRDIGLQRPMILGFDPNPASSRAARGEANGAARRPPAASHAGLPDSENSPLPGSEGGPGLDRPRLRPTPMKPTPMKRKIP